MNMGMSRHEQLADEEVEIEDSWGISVTDQLERSRRTAWIVAAVMAVIALLLAIAIVIMLPLKSVEPYTILVDRQTGNVETLDPLTEATVSPDTALTRSLLVQYVTTREGFDLADVQEDYRKVALWSGGDERQRYEALMSSSNPTSPLSIYPRGTRVSVEIRSLSSLAANRALVRFTTVTTDRGGRASQAQHWAAVVDYTFVDAPMSEADRFINPLGFQVTRYRVDPETLPEVMEELEASLPDAPPGDADSGEEQ